MKFSVLGLSLALFAGNALGAPAVDTPPSKSLSERQTDTVLVQFGLLEGYHYPRVSSTPRIASEISRLTPKALGYAYSPNGHAEGDFKVEGLNPLDTQSSLGYITTLVTVRVPKDVVEKLRGDIKNSGSRFYNHPEKEVRDFTAQVNGGIDITYRGS